MIAFAIAAAACGQNPNVTLRLHQDAAAVGVPVLASSAGVAEVIAARIPVVMRHQQSTALHGWSRAFAWRPAVLAAKGNKGQLDFFVQPRTTHGGKAIFTSTFASDSDRREKGTNGGMAIERHRLAEFAACAAAGSACETHMFTKMVLGNLGHDLAADLPLEHSPFRVVETAPGRVEPKRRPSMARQMLQRHGFAGGDHDLWVGTQGSVSTLHYDLQHNFYVNLFGAKQFVLMRPGPHAPLHPATGPCQRQARNASAVLGGDDDDAAAPKRLWHVTLSVGDVLYIPPLWLHSGSVLSGGGAIAASVCSASLEEARIDALHRSAIPFEAEWSCEANRRALVRLLAALGGVLRPAGVAADPGAVLRARYPLEARTTAFELRTDGRGTGHDDPCALVCADHKPRRGDPTLSVGGRGGTTNDEDDPAASRDGLAKLRSGAERLGARVAEIASFSSPEAAQVVLDDLIEAWAQFFFGDVAAFLKCAAAEYP